MPRSSLTLLNVLGAVAVLTLAIAPTTIEARAICPHPVAVTASSFYGVDVPTRAYDCDVTVTNSWNAGTSAPSWIQCDLGHKTAFKGIHLFANANPTCTETYVVRGSNDGTAWTTIVTSTRTVLNHGTVNEFVEAFPSNVQFRHLRIEISGDGASWISLNDVQLER